MNHDVKTKTSKRYRKSINLLKFALILSTGFFSPVSFALPAAKDLPGLLSKNWINIVMNSDESTTVEDTFFTCTVDSNTVWQVRYNKQARGFGIFQSQDGVISEHSGFFLQSYVLNVPDNNNFGLAKGTRFYDLDRNPSVSKFRPFMMFDDTGMGFIVLEHPREISSLKSIIPCQRK